MVRLQQFGHLALTNLLLAIPISASTFQMRNLFERAPTCAKSSDIQCGASVPSNFCCRSTEVCNVIGGNTTVLCCAAGADCRLISPIDCNIQTQNITASPLTGLMTTLLSQPLAVCASGCCPWGYSCSSGGCMLDPSAPVPTGSATGTATSPVATKSNSPTTLTVSPISITSTPSSASSTSSPTANPVTTTCTAFPIAAILAGLFPGLILGILLSVACFCLIGAHNRKKERKSTSRNSFGRVHANVSDPIYNEGSMRSDFLRKQPGTPQTITAQRTPSTVKRVASRIFRRPGTAGTAGTTSTMVGGDGGGGNYTSKQSPQMSTGPLAPAPLTLKGQGPRIAGPVRPENPSSSAAAAPPRTPTLQRQPSTESINIFADPSTARSGGLGVGSNGGRGGGGNFRDSSQTTVTTFMRDARDGGGGGDAAATPPMPVKNSGAVPLAGLRKGEPFGSARLSPARFERGSPRGRG